MDGEVVGESDLFPVYCGTEGSVRGEIGDEGTFGISLGISRSLLGPSDKPLSCNARIRSAIEPPRGVCACWFSLDRFRILD